MPIAHAAAARAAHSAWIHGSDINAMTSAKAPAVPAVVISGVFSIPDVFHKGGAGLTPSGAQMVVATLIAFVLGFASIAWLLRYVAHHTFYPFVLYRVAVGATVLALLISGTVAAT